MQSILRKASYGPVKVFWLDREEAIRILKEKVSSILKEQRDVKKVFLFGSLAQGTAVPGSDADLLLVLSSSSKRFLDRSLQFLPYFEDVGLPVDLFCYTEEELEQISFAKSALRNALPL